MSEFQELRGVLNAIRREFTDVSVLCIPWLHLKHPSHPVQEKLMGRGAARTEDNIQRSWTARVANHIINGRSVFFRSALCVVNAARLSIKIAALRWTLRREIAALSGMKFRILAKSWGFGPKGPSDNEKDFYYGDLQRRLSSQDVQMLTLCGDANNSDWQTFARNHISVQSPFRLPELCLCPVMSPLSTAAAQIRASRALRRSASNTNNKTDKEARIEASLDCLNPAVTQDSLFFDVAGVATDTWKPQAFITLYEGHGWEKAAWWGIKTRDRNCRTVGYQHTVLFPEALSMLDPFVDIRERSIPDVVLALGDQTAQLLKSSHEKHGVDVARFGTFRYQGQQVSTSADPAVRTVLVLPEGIAEEAEALFRFAYQAAQAMPGYRFILRGHPQWPAEKALAQMHEPVLSLPNIEVSDRAKIDDDFQRASVLLYRGSSSVLYGILNGLLPVLVRLPDMFVSDPIYQLKTWKQICETAAELPAMLGRHESKTPGERDAEWQQAAAYVNRYITPVDEQSIESLLHAIGIKPTHTRCTA
jgi:hypothetical protein